MFFCSFIWRFSAVRAPGCPVPRIPMVKFDMLWVCDAALHVSFVAEGSELFAGSLAVASFAANEKLSKSIADKTLATRAIERPTRRAVICTPQVQTPGAH
jgi:hypothetical protein